MGFIIDDDEFVTQVVEATLHLDYLEKYKTKNGVLEFCHFSRPYRLEEDFNGMKRGTMVKRAHFFKEKVNA